MHAFALRTQKAVAKAVKEAGGKTPLKWFSNLSALEVVDTKLRGSQVEHLFLAKSTLGKKKYGPIQLAASTLLNSKYALAKGYVLLHILFGEKVRPLYTGKM